MRNNYYLCWEVGNTKWTKDFLLLSEQGAKRTTNAESRTHHFHSKGARLLFHTFLHSITTNSILPSPLLDRVTKDVSSLYGMTIRTSCLMAWSAPRKAILLDEGSVISSCRTRQTGVEGTILCPYPLFDCDEEDVKGDVSDIDMWSLAREHFG